MYEFYQFWLEIRDKPIRWGTLAVFLLFIIDKLGRKLIISELRRIFHLGDKDAFREYAANQKRIEYKIDALSAHLGVMPVSIPSETGRSGVQNSKKWSPIFSPVLYLANQFGRVTKKMQNQINFVTMIVAILGAVKLILQTQGIDVIDDQQIDSIANGVAAIITIVGVFMTHRKPAENVSNAEEAYH